jgi:hypothetical protein
VTGWRLLLSPGKDENIFADDLERIDRPEQLLRDRDRTVRTPAAYGCWTRPLTPREKAITTSRPRRRQIVTAEPALDTGAHTPMALLEDRLRFVGVGVHQLCPSPTTTSSSETRGS